MQTTMRWLASVGAATLAACGGGGGGGGDGGLLPLLASDELVATVAPEARVRNFQVLQAGAAIYAAWIEREAEVADVDGVRFTRSLDHGRTWLANALRLDDPALGDADDLSMACDGPRVYVVYSKGNSNGTIRIARSLDAGATFDVRDGLVSGPSAVEPEIPEVVCDGDVVHVAWTDARSGAGTPPLREVRYTRSTDAGATFPGTDVQLNTDAPGTADCLSVRLCGDATHVYAVWLVLHDDVLSMRSNRSADGGDTFLAADVAVSHAPGSLNDLDSLNLACNGDVLVVLWIDDRTVPADVYLNRSVDGGVTFLSQDRRVRDDVRTGPSGGTTALCLEGDTVHALWEDRPVSGDEVRYARSDDLGLTFPGDDVRVGNTPFPGSGVNVTAIRCSGEVVVAAWTESRVGAPSFLQDAFVGVSEDGGLAFVEGRVNTTPPGTAETRDPRPFLTDDGLTVVFHGDRDGGTQVRVNRSAR